MLTLTTFTNIVLKYQPQKLSKKKGIQFGKEGGKLSLFADDIKKIYTYTHTHTHTHIKFKIFHQNYYN